MAAAQLHRSRYARTNTHDRRIIIASDCHDNCCFTNVGPNLLVEEELVG